MIRAAFLAVTLPAFLIALVQTAEAKPLFTSLDKVFSQHPHVVVARLAGAPQAGAVGLEILEVLRGGLSKGVFEYRIVTVKYDVGGKPRMEGLPPVSGCPQPSIRMDNFAGNKMSLSFHPRNLSIKGLILENLGRFPEGLAVLKKAVSLTKQPSPELLEDVERVKGKAE